MWALLLRSLQERGSSIRMLPMPSVRWELLQWWHKVPQYGGHMQLRLCGIPFTPTEGKLPSQPKLLCQGLPRSEFLHIVSLESAFIRKIIRVILPFKQNIDVEPEEEEEYLRKIRRVTSYRSGKRVFIFSLRNRWLRLPKLQSWSVRGQFNFKDARWRRPRWGHYRKRMPWCWIYRSFRFKQAVIPW